MFLFILIIDKYFSLASSVLIMCLISPVLSPSLFSHARSTQATASLSVSATW